MKTLSANQRMDVIVIFIMNLITTNLIISTEVLLRVSEANEVPISSHIWVALSTLNRLYLGNEAFWTYDAGNKKCLF